MVTHDQTEAMTMADRIVVMNAGRIVQIGTPVEIYSEPADLFVADFIGAMNFLAGIIVGPHRVCIGGVEISCSSNGLASGTPVVAAVRPEDIVIERAGSGDGDGPYARLGHVEFFGSYCSAELEWAPAGPSPLRVHLPKNFVRRPGMATNERLRVTLPYDSIRLLPQAQ